jgi:hypothetical protein
MASEKTDVKEVKVKAEKKEVKAKSDDKKSEEKSDDKEVEGKKAPKDAPPSHLGWNSHEAVVSLSFSFYHIDHLFSISLSHTSKQYTIYSCIS